LNASSSAGTSDRPPVRLADAFYANCPYCRAEACLTPNATEAREAAAAGNPIQPVLNEAIPVGGDQTVHFVDCAGCSKKYVVRMALKNSAAFQRYREMKRFHPAIEAPKPRMSWQACSFRQWMTEVLTNSNWMLRAKAQRECLNRGIVLDWERVANDIATRAEGTTP